MYGSKSERKMAIWGTADMSKKRGNGEGSIFQDKSGRWRGVITVGINVNGSQKRKTFYGKTRKEVSEKLNQALNNLQSHVCVEASKMKLSDWLNHWLNIYAVHDLRLSTKVAYETYIRGHIVPALGNIPLTKLTPQRLQEYYNNKLENGRLDGKGGLDPKTVRNLHNMLHKALEQAVKLDLIPRNPSNATVLPQKKKKEIHFLTVEEQFLLQQAVAGERLGIGIMIDLFTGLRLGELLGLTWENIDLDVGVLRVRQTVNRLKDFNNCSDNQTRIVIGEPKTEHSKRSIPLLPELITMLKVHRAKQEVEKKNSFGAYQDKGFVLCNELGQPYEPKTYQDFFKRMVKKADIRDINFHGLRHTFATRALEKGIPAKTVSELLGHSTITITLDLYTHVTEDLKRDAISQLEDLLQ